MVAEKIKPIYVLVGDDSFLRDAHRREIVSLAIGQGDPQVCVSALGPQAEPAEVLDDVRTLPFLAERRVVIVDDADSFVSSHRELLERYLQAPSSSGTLMLMVSAWDARTNLAKLVQKVGEVKDCSAPEPRKVLAWLGRAAAKRGKKLSREAGVALLESLGPDLGMLSVELDKLASYAAQRETITEEDVSLLVTATVGPGRYDLTNAITAGDVKAALKALDGMLVRPGAEFAVLGQLGWHLRRVLQDAQQVAEGRQPDLRMPGDAKRAYMDMLRRRPLDRLQADFRRLIRADLGMKSGLEPVAAMQELVVGLCS